MEPQFRRESVLEFFRELVDGAIARQGIRAADSTAWYVVHLLAGFLERPDVDTTPLALRLTHALEADGSERRITLREIGDVSLFLSGFFADSFRRRPVDVDYYIAIGGSAYTALSRFDAGALSPVFGELADKFVGFVDVLSEVSDRTSCSSNADLLRLYERWLKTRSRRAGRLLADHGIVLGSGSQLVQ